MRKAHAALVATAAVALIAGSAYAAGKLNTMNVTLPDGSVAQIAYAGDVAPQVRVVPVEAVDPFIEMQRMQAAMQARHEAMMRQIAEMQQRTQAQVLAAQQGRAGASGQIVVSTNAPAGSYSFVSVSTATSADGCTQTVETRSDGSGAEPKITRTSSGDCGAAQKDAAPKAPAVSPSQARMPSRTT